MTLRNDDIIEIYKFAISGRYGGGMIAASYDSVLFCGVWRGRNDIRRAGVENEMPAASAALKRCRRSYENDILSVTAAILSHGRLKIPIS